MKYFILFVLLIFIFSCSTTEKIINISSTKENIVDSCLNYIKEVPPINKWNCQVREFDNIYYYNVPIYNKKNKEIGYYTLISKPFLYIMGRDSLINNQKQYLTIIKKDKKP